MKRELFSNVKVIPGGMDAAIDRSGFLSAVIGASVTTATGDQTLSFAVTHCDTSDGSFEAVNDPFIGVEGIREAAMIRRYDAPQKAEEKKEKKTKDSGEVKKPAETKMQGGPSENK